MSFIVKLEKSYNIMRKSGYKKINLEILKTTNELKNMR